MSKNHVKKLNDDDEILDDEEEFKEPDVMNLGEDSRVLGLFGSVDIIKTSQLIGMMIEMTDTSVVDLSKMIRSSDEDREKSEIEFLISTNGGSVEDMFGLYDTMRMVRERCDIVTVGVGKVMSAGVLLLASGTKGKRRIGKHCRVMIHSVIAGAGGSFHSLENHMKETRNTQNSYLKAIAEETNMTLQELKRMTNKKVDIYLSAEEAVKLGIADIIV